MKKTAEIIRFQRLVGCGERTRTSDLRVMSCGLDVGLPPLGAFVPFLLGTKCYLGLFAPLIPPSPNPVWVTVWVKQHGIDLD